MFLKHLSSLNLSLTKLVYRLINSRFLQASSLIFVINLLVAAVNYSVPILVRNLTDKEFFPSWVALNSTVAITLVIYTALQTEFTKRVSFNYTHYGLQSAKNYLEFMKSGLTKIFWLSTPFWPGLIWLINITSPVNNWFLATIVMANLFFQGYAVLHSSYLLGILRVWDFGIGLLLATITRPIVTTMMLLLGWELYALPLGYIVFALALLAHSVWVIHRLNLSVDPQSQNNQSDTQSSAISEIPSFRLTTESWGLLKTVLSFFMLSAIFNLVAIVGERVLALQDRYLLAVLFTFGQIIHYGAIAFLGAFVAYSAKSKNLKIYLTSVAAVALITLGIAVGFWLFGPWLLALMKSLEYTSQMLMILYFSVFVGLYNIIYVSTQYLISRNDYFLFVWLALAMGLQILLLTNSNWIGLAKLDLFQFISINLVIAGVVMLALVARVFFLKENQNNCQ